MRTNTIIQYIANDGTVFDNEQWCIDYETTDACVRNRITELVKINCGETYNDDAGFSVIEQYDVVEFIMRTADEIQKIMQDHKDAQTQSNP